MTALNVWQNGRQAFILTDTAVTDPAGRLIGDQPKVLNIDGLLFGERAAIAISGWATLEMLAMCIDEKSFMTADDLIRAMPGIVKRLSSDLRRLSPRDAYFPGIGVVIAVNGPAASRPSLTIIADDSGEMMPSDYVGYQPVQVRYWTTGMEAYGPFTYDGEGRDIAFDPHTEGLAMLEHQRSSPFEDGNYRIGGRAMLTVVGSHGVHTEALRAWPDAIGYHIKPT